MHACVHALLCVLFVLRVVFRFLYFTTSAPLDDEVDNDPISPQKNQNGNKEKDFVGESAGSHLHEDTPGLARQGIGVRCRVRGPQQGLALRRQGGHHSVCGKRV